MDPKCSSLWYGSREWLLHVILTDNQLPAVNEDVQRLFDELHPLHLSLRPHFLRWAETGQIEKDLGVNGWTIAEIQFYQPGFGVTGAFGMLDALVLDFDRAVRIVSRRPFMAHLKRRTLLAH